jgi:hypothetical protein
VAGGPDVGLEFSSPLDEVVAQSCETHRLALHRLGGGDESRGETDDGRGVEGARAHLPLLPTPVAQRHEASVAPCEQRPDPDRSTELVRGD